MDAINNLGPSYKKEMPNLPDPAFEKDVKKWMKTKKVSEIQAVIFKTLENVAGETDIDALRILEKGRNSKIQFENDEKGIWLSNVARFLYETKL